MIIFLFDQLDTVSKLFLKKKKKLTGEFPGGPVFGTQGFHCSVPGLDPWSEN